MHLQRLCIWWTRYLKNFRPNWLLCLWMTYRGWNHTSRTFESGVGNIKNTSTNCNVVKVWILVGRSHFLGACNHGRIKGIIVDLGVVKAMVEWNQPRNATKIRSFLGLVGYYWRFIENFSKIALPLTNLTRIGVKYEWTHDCETSFQELKKRLTTASVLALPTTEDMFVVYCDALCQGLSCDT